MFIFRGIRFNKLLVNRQNLVLFFIDIDIFLNKLLIVKTETSFSFVFLTYAAQCGLTTRLPPRRSMDCLLFLVDVG